MYTRVVEILLEIACSLFDICFIAVPWGL